MQSGLKGTIFLFGMWNCTHLNNDTKTHIKSFESVTEMDKITLTIRIFLIFKTNVSPQVIMEFHYILCQSQNVSPCIRDIRQHHTYFSFYVDYIQRVCFGVLQGAVFVKENFRLLLLIFKKKTHVIEPKHSRYTYLQYVSSIALASCNMIRKLALLCFSKRMWCSKHLLQASHHPLPCL